MDKDSSDDENQISEESFCEKDMIPENLILSKDGKISYSTIEPRKTKKLIKDICKFTPGLNFRSKKIHDELDAFLTFIDYNIIDNIIMFSNNYAEGANISTTMTIEDAFRWIGINLFFGLTKSKNMNLTELWGTRYGSNIVQSSMTLNKFNTIKRILRFDMKSKRTRNDKLAPFDAFFDKFCQNLRSSYVPSEQLTVDEQLVTFRGRCNFKVYMPSKPGKYGIKLWAVCDAKNGFVCNAQIYTGKVGHSPERNQGQRVVLDICNPYLNRGRTITCDNFFTSYDLALKLLKKKTCIVGTVRKSRVFLPVSFQHKKIPLGNMEYIFNDLVTILNYGDKKDKSVVLLSTLHNGKSQSEGKPEIITYYNQTKIGVDLADQVIRNYSCKRGTRRWPLCLFYNCLDIAAYNAYIIYRLKFPEFYLQHLKNSRREFLYNLSTTLMSYSEDTIFKDGDEFTAETEKTVNSFTSERKRCYLCPSHPGIKSQMICHKCENFVCRNHCGVVCKNCQ